ncbi:hypothetical protein H6F93_07390 [Leptolyngbya sp. FACHB-671]|uniref:hypothetical protein n=1 Tax=Leptolyngbya sp. FACHB-671 TaxID=2692812 RepID=UPI0016820A2E|nr:hypothetical protein [Leptolyngbya sp. FACHB-671]MBD2067353.1 hypothetical protein [Leptolyngbya sp. FACHB-671]
MGLQRLIRRYWSKTFVLLGGIGLAVFGSVADIQRDGLKWFNASTGRFFGFSALLTIVGSVDSFRDADRNEKLEKEIANLESVVELRANFFLIIKKSLEQLAREIDFEGTERISIYFHNESHEFISIGRYSENPNFDKKGRLSYPDNEGCIGKAWNDGSGEAFVDDLPDPETNLNEYLDTLKQDWNVKKETARRFTMKSRTYYGYALKSDELPTRRIAIILFESTKAKAFTKDILGSQRNLRIHLNTLRQLVIITSFLKLSPQQASDEGY